MQSGIIRLLFKKDNPTNQKNWQPISLLNIDYKIQTKVLALRIQTVMDKLLDPLQSSCVKDRNILNNVLNLENLIQYVELNNWNATFISLDNEKAFDRIEQNYVLKVLDKYNFPSEFTSWIKILYKNISAKVIVYGTFTENINISRSIRQGCPLSMLLYILSLEPLIHSIQNNPKIDGLKIPNYKHEIKVLTHADDMTAMVRNDWIDT